ncbi:Hypothetical protein PBC10988_31460 [Planctomycetales bacterium 10988]|nr:Hypothetical protein PBC10988_31460 [Planctomycetales bacterium 10988]
MQVYLISDDPLLSHQTSELLQSMGFETPPDSILSWNQAAEVVHLEGIFLFVLGSNPQRTLTQLSSIFSKFPSSEPPGQRVAIGPHDADIILKALTHVNEYVPDIELEKRLRGAIERLLLQDQERQAQGKIVSILGPSGGSGASNIAANLATACCNQTRTLLIDMDLQFGSLDALLDLEVKRSLTDLCELSSDFDYEMLQQIFCRTAQGLSVLASPRCIRRSQIIGKTVMDRLIALSREHFNLTVLDVDRAFRESHLTSLLQSDLILIILRLDFTSLRNVRQMLMHLEGLGVVREQIELVVNRGGQAKEMRVNQAEIALGRRIFHILPEDTKHVLRSVGLGVPVLVQAPRSKIAQSMIGFAEKVSARCALQLV